MGSFFFPPLRNWKVDTPASDHSYRSAQYEIRVQACHKVQARTRVKPAVPSGGRGLQLQDGDVAEAGAPRSGDMCCMRPSCGDKRHTRWRVFRRCPRSFVAPAFFRQRRSRGNDSGEEEQRGFWIAGEEWAPIAGKAAQRRPDGLRMDPTQVCAQGTDASQKGRRRVLGAGAVPSRVRDLACIILRH